MTKSYGVQKLVSRFSLTVAGLAMLLGQSGIAASNLNKNSTQTSSKFNTTGRVRAGAVQQRSQHNFISLKDFKSQLNVKVQEYQKVAACTSLENSTQTMSYKSDGSAKVVSGLVQVTHGQSLIDQKDGNQQASQSVMARLSGAVSKNFNLLGQVSATKDLKYTESERLNDISDLSLILSQKHIEFADWLKGGFGITSILPLSKYSTAYQSYQGSLGLSYSLALTEAVLAKGLKTSISFGISRNFHEYETDKAGRILNAYGMRESLSTSYDIGSFSFSFEFLHRHAWNYEGAVSESFEHTEEISYALSKQWGVSLGHTNSGSWLAPNGRDSNLKLINDNDSIIYGSMTLMF